MASSNLLKEAIADAKAVRETAIANAKLALEEAFTPRLQSMLSNKIEEELEENEELEEQSDSSNIGAGDNKVNQASGDDEEKSETEKTSAAYGSEDSNVKVVDKLTEEAEEDEETEMEDEKEEMKEQLEEAYNTIKSLKSTLNEVNLLNAKLMFSNKLFKSQDLTESQKMRVIETFDRASNLREVKLVYTTLAESMQSRVTKVAKKKATVTEGLASKAQKTTKPKTVIAEGNEMASRMKKLAGLL